jgi:hypothetical protein
MPVYEGWGGQQAERSEARKDDHQAHEVRGGRTDSLPEDAGLSLRAQRRSRRR